MQNKRLDLAVRRPRSPAPAFDAFDPKIADHLRHAAFGAVKVTAKEARMWSRAWALERVTKAEAHTMIEVLLSVLRKDDFYCKTIK